MDTILTILLILCVILWIRSIKIKVDIDDTYWQEKDTGRIVLVKTYFPELGVIFEFEDQEGLLRCPLISFLKEFKQYHG